MPTEWLDQMFEALAGTFPEGSYFSMAFNLRALLAVLFVSFTCGAVGSLVVGNRMAFFSDALSHCVFAGVGLGLIFGFVFGIAREAAFIDWGIPAATVVFGVVVGMGIAFVREQTSLASDTVIGVFFAGALGLGAILLKQLAKYTPPNFLETLVFGDIVTIRSADLLLLFGLTVATGGLLAWMYNSLVFSSFNPSLARSRRVPVRLCNYLFIILLAIIVNVCLRVVGALLINAMLVVPAAAAGNVARNMRQLFWLTVALCLVSGLGGLWLSWDVAPAGSGGSIVVVSVLLFFASMLFSIKPIRQLWERRTGSLAKPSSPSDNNPAGDEPARA